MDLDLNQSPKQFTDKFVFGLGKEHFVLALICGTNVQSFAVTRSVAKQMVKVLQETVEQSEKLYGPIKDEWASGIPSPIQSLGSDTPPENSPKK